MWNVYILYLDFSNFRNIYVYWNILNAAMKTLSTDNSVSSCLEYQVDWIYLAVIDCYFSILQRDFV